MLPPICLRLPALPSHHAQISLAAVAERSPTQRSGAQAAHPFDLSIGALFHNALTRIGHEPQSLSVVQLAITPSGCMYTLIVPLEPNRVPDRVHSQFQETYYGEPHHRDLPCFCSGIPP